ncbi:MAG: hypothetical protein AB1742_01210 [bacterium]
MNSTPFPAPRRRLRQLIPAAPRFPHRLVSRSRAAARRPTTTPAAPAVIIYAVAAMKIQSRTPVRIDLAGGTLDIFPLYVLEGGAVTVNAAVNLLSEVEIHARGDGRIEIIAEDLGESALFDDLASLLPGGPLDLIARVIAFYKPETGITVRTRSGVPKGSGLGASSALLIALSHALNELIGAPCSKEDIIHTGANLEAQSIRIPTGKQDYYSATRGGVNAIWFQVNGDQIEPLDPDGGVKAFLEENLVLSFTGQSHFSAVSNWNMIKAYVDGVHDTVRRFGRIREIAMLMRSILLEKRFDRFPEALAMEWENRKNLAEGVSTHVIEELMAAAKAAGAEASKICGAGGGGCMISCVHPSRRRDVERALSERGAKIIPFLVDTTGLVVSKEP